MSQKTICSMAFQLLKSRPPDAQNVEECFALADEWMQECRKRGVHEALVTGRKPIPVTYEQLKKAIAQVSPGKECADKESVAQVIGVSPKTLERKVRQIPNANVEQGMVFIR